MNRQPVTRCRGPFSKSFDFDNTWNSLRELANARQTLIHPGEEHCFTASFVGEKLGPTTVLRGGGGEVRHTLFQLGDRR